MFTPRSARARQTFPSEPGRLSMRMVSSSLMGIGDLLRSQQMNSVEVRRGWRTNLTTSFRLMQGNIRENWVYTPAERKSERFLRMRSLSDRETNIHSFEPGRRSVLAARPALNQ